MIRRPRVRAKTSYRIRLRLPYQLCSRVWDANISLTRSRFNLDIQTYNVVPRQSAIFYFCERGDLVGMGNLLQSGKAGLLDVRPTGEDGFETLIEVRYFLNCCSWAELMIN